MTATELVTDTVVIARDVRKTFGDNVVLNGLNLEIRSGEFVALLGRSGSGKSTFLRALGALDGDFEGYVLGAGAAGHRLSRSAAAAVATRVDQRHHRPSRDRRGAGAGAGGTERSEPRRQGQGMAAHVVRGRGSARRVGAGAGASSPNCCCSTNRSAPSMR